MYIPQASPLDVFLPSRDFKNAEKLSFNLEIECFPWVLSLFYLSFENFVGLTVAFYRITKCTPILKNLLFNLCVYVWIKASFLQLKKDLFFWNMPKIWVFSLSFEFFPPWVFFECPKEKPGVNVSCIPFRKGLKIFLFQHILKLV